MPARAIALHDLGDRRGFAEGLHRSSEGEEHPAVPVAWAAALEILSQCCADLLGHGQHPLAAAFAGPQTDLSRTPVQVAELEGDDLARTQAEARQQQQDRTVPVLRRAKPGNAGRSA
jgi:hypothetical protein